MFVFRFCNLLVAHPCFGLVPFRCGSRVCPFLEFFHLFYIMEAPCVLEWTIHVELGNFPEGTTVPDIAKLILDFFTEDAQFSVVAIQQSQNRTTWVTFEDGGRQQRLRMRLGRLLILRAWSERYSPLPLGWRGCSSTTFPMRTQTPHGKGTFCIWFH